MAAMRSLDSEDPWRLCAHARPATGHARERLLDALRHALLAWSVNNTQPWRWRLARDAAELLLDPEHRLPELDPAGRQATMSCGAALANACLALEVQGQPARVQRWPRASESSCTARLELGPLQPVGARAQALCGAIPSAGLSRASFQARALPLALRASLEQEALRCGAELVELRREAKSAAAELIATADRAQQANERLRAELARWIAPHPAQREDGLGLPSWARAQPGAARRFEWARLGVPAGDAELASGCPHLAVLCTRTDEPADWLAAGEALQRVLLGARVGRACACTLDQAIEVESARSALARLVGPGRVPQSLLRLGYGPAPEREPRRPLQRVLDEVAPIEL